MIAANYRQLSHLGKYFLSLICIFALVVGCSKKKSNDRGTITFVTGKVFLNGKKAKTGDSLFKNAQIKTGKKSLAVIQFQNHTLITLRENTNIKIAALFLQINKKSKVQIKQNIGTTFSKILKNKTDFTIVTPTIVAGVRGTAFSVTAETNSSTIRILRGKVSLKKTAASLKKGEDKALIKEIIISEGEKMEISSNTLLTKQSLSLTEKKNLELMEKVAFLDKTDKKEEVVKKSKFVVPSALKPKIIEELDIDQIRSEDKEKKEIRNIQKKKVLTLAELEEKYGTLSIIITKDDKKITGSFQKKGNNMEIMTVKGKVTIPMEQVKMVQPIKQ